MKFSHIILIFFVVLYVFRTATVREFLYPERYWTKKLDTAVYTVQVDREMLEEARLAGNKEDVILWTFILEADQADVIAYQDKLFQRVHNP